MSVAGTVRLALISLVVCALVVLAFPDHTSVAVRVETFVLALLGALALVRFLRYRSPDAPASPFEPAAAARVVSAVPAELERHALELRALATAPGPAPLPGGLRRTIRAIAASRLAEHHGLRLDDDGAGPLIRRDGGDALWRALCGEPVTTTPDELVRALEAL